MRPSSALLRRLLNRERLVDALRRHRLAAARDATASRPALAIGRR